jgi:prepilin-type N-terminal cleavage/methylation domain-containing protein
MRTIDMRNQLFPKRPGFTLVELVMVILIVSILSIALATDLISSTLATKIEAAKWKVKSDIRYAQVLAVTQQVNHGVIFNPSLETYSLYRQNTTNIITNPLTTSAFTVNFVTDNTFKNVNLVSTSLGSPTTNRLEFDSYGIPYSGGTPADKMAADGTVSLSLGSLNATVTVEYETGNVY